MISAKLKPEITCPLCNQIFQTPLLLPCGHSICSGCIGKFCKTVTKSSNVTATTNNNNNQTHYPITQTNSSTGIEDAVSEADSGVVVCSLESNHDCQSALYSHQTINRTQSIQELCRICSTTHSNSNLLKNTSLNLENRNNETLSNDILPHNIALENLITRITKTEFNHHHQQQDKETTINSEIIKKDNNSLSAIRCQLCETSNEILTLSFCEQCNLWYCKTCLKLWHPPIEILIKHRITSFNNHNRLSYSSKQIPNELTGPICTHHTGYICNLYCITCSMFVCLRCLNSNERSYNSDQNYQNINNTNNSSRDVNTPSSYTSSSAFPHQCLSHIGHTVCSTTIYAKKMKVSNFYLVRSSLFMHYSVCWEHKKCYK
ncbi:unnamed protein product [Schistosoma turkestanicum]|nr:unnamed protein product [Schistosoma turkestanicum]